MLSSRDLERIKIAKRLKIPLLTKYLTDADLPIELVDKSVYMALIKKSLVWFGV